MGCNLGEETENTGDSWYISKLAACCGSSLAWCQFWFDRGTSRILVIEGHNFISHCEDFLLIERWVDGYRERGKSYFLHGKDKECCIHVLFLLRTIMCSDALPNGETHASVLPSPHLSHKLLKKRKVSSLSQPLGIYKYHHADNSCIKWSFKVPQHQNDLGTGSWEFIEMQIIFPTALYRGMLPRNLCSKKIFKSFFYKMKAEETILKQRRLAKNTAASFC